jgi:type II secretory pathway component PulF
MPPPLNVRCPPEHELVSALAWAARSGQTFQEAVEGCLAGSRVTPRVESIPLFFLGWMLFVPELFFREMLRQRFCQRARRLQELLDRGWALGLALDKCFGRRLPAFCAVALTDAEADGRLAEVLPVIAERLRYHSPGSQFGAVWFQWITVYLSVVVTITSGLFIFIVPKFNKITAEMWGYNPTVDDLRPHLSPFNELLLAAADKVMEVTNAAVLSGLVGPIVLALATAPLFLSRPCRALLLRVPVLGARWQLWERLQVANAMAAALQCGGDLSQAAELARRAAVSGGMRRRLSRFMLGVADGSDWRREWEAARIGSPFERWLVTTSGAREAPAHGFVLMAAHLLEAQVVSERRLERWAPIFAAGANAVIVGSVVLTIAANLLLITEATLGML